MQDIRQPEHIVKLRERSLFFRRLRTGAGSRELVVSLADCGNLLDNPDIAGYIYLTLLLIKCA
jgi:hypothetical protein